MNKNVLWPKFKFPVINHFPYTSGHSHPHCANGFIIYVDILSGENLSLFLTWTSFIGQFVHTVGGEVMG